MIDRGGRARSAAGLGCSIVGLRAVPCNPGAVVSIGGAREVMLNVELRLFAVAVDRVDADRPRFEPPVALVIEDVERRKLGFRLRICWLARREGAGDGGAGRELERDEARERLAGPARAIERLVPDSGRRRATGVEVPSL